MRVCFGRYTCLELEHSEDRIPRPWYPQLRLSISFSNMCEAASDVEEGGMCGGLRSARNTVSALHLRQRDSELVCRRPLAGDVVSPRGARHSGPAESLTPAARSH